MGARERTCVGCRRSGPRGALVRLVRLPDGTAIVDPGGAPGRGAYVHRDERCLDAARGRLAGALRAGRVDFEGIRRELLEKG